MRGIVVNYRGGKHTQYKYQVIVQPENVFTKEEAAKKKEILKKNDYLL